MANRFSTVRDLFHHLTADSPSITKTIARGRRELLHDEGGNSIFAWPAIALARKLKGREQVNEALYQSFHRPLKNVDEKAGKFLAEAFHAPKLFRQVDVLPTSGRIGGNRALIEHETHSATAPIGKASKVITPIAASLYVANALSGNDEEKMGAAAAVEVEDKDALLKEASDALISAAKTKKAEKLAFQMVERGTIPPFDSYQAFQEKVASLLEKGDLRVVEEALEMTAGDHEIGKVAAAGGKPPEGNSTGLDQATSSFFHTLAEE